MDTEGGGLTLGHSLHDVQEADKQAASFGLVQLVEARHVPDEGLWARHLERDAGWGGTPP